VQNPPIPPVPSYYNPAAGVPARPNRPTTPTPPPPSKKHQDCVDSCKNKSLLNNGVSMALSLGSYLTAELPPVSLLFNAAGFMWSMYTMDGKGALAGGGSAFGSAIKSGANNGTMSAAAGTAGANLSRGSTGIGFITSAYNLAEDLATGCEEECKNVQ
jgi:hypothetical protein